MMCALFSGALMLAACGTDDEDLDGAEAADEDAPDDPAEADTYELEMLLTPSNVAMAIAQEEGFFEIVDLDWTLVGFGESAALFVAGDSPVGQESPWEVAAFRAEGEDIVYFGTPAALNFFSGVIIRAEDADQYRSLSDLEGVKLGHPGFGTGTWQAFEIISQSIYGLDARTDFEPVQADPGALLGLLETGEIEATINFTGQTATSLTRDDFEVITNFSQNWEEQHGHKLVINGMMARGDWIADHMHVAADLVQGTNRGLQWMKDNPEAFQPGGEWASFVEGEGWLADDATNEKIIQLLMDGEWYLDAGTYTDEWIDSMYEFISQGEGVFADQVPPKDEIFVSPDLLQP